MSPAGGRKRGSRGGGGGRSRGQRAGRTEPSGGRPVGARGAGSRGGAARAGGRGGGRRPTSSSGSGGRSRGAGSERGLGGEQVEGRQAVRELLLAGRRKVHELIVLARDHDRGDDDLARLARELRVAVREVSRGKFDAEARTEAPQGVIARAAALTESDLDDLAHGSDGQPPFLVALDGITDPGNLGAILRSAECAGATGIVLPRHRAVRVTPAAAKAAAGAIEYLPLAVVGGLPTALRDLQKRGLWIVGLDHAGDQPLHELALAEEGVALVVGSEGRGLARLTRERCDVLVSIGLHGRLESLNAAAAAAVACFEVARRRSA